MANYISTLYSFYKSLELNRKRICVFYSGGPDSVLLLQSLRGYKQKLNLRDEDFEITVIHFNFSGSEIVSANKENAEFVSKTLADEKDISLKILNSEIIASGKGPEADARKIKDKFMIDHAKYFDYFFLGHNKDDHIETVLIQLFRGAGRGIRGIPDKQKGKIVRPLLDFSKADIIKICDQTKLPYFMDPCNFDIKYTRNFWRNEIIPKLKDHYTETGLYKKINTISKILGP
jgi:tRNA(Ile)-lysidine synthase